MDLRVKLKWVSAFAEKNTREEILERITTDFEKYMGEKEGEESPESQQTDPLDIFAMYQSEILNNNAPKKTELERYLENTIMGTNGFDVLTYWRTVGCFEFPKIAAIARAYLSIPASSASVERLFSSGRDQYGVRRGRLSPEMFPHLLWFCSTTLVLSDKN